MHLVLLILLIIIFLVVVNAFSCPKSVFRKFNFTKTINHTFHHHNIFHIIYLLYQETPTEKPSMCSSFFTGFVCAFFFPYSTLFLFPLYTIPPFYPMLWVIYFWHISCVPTIFLLLLILPFILRVLTNSMDYFSLITPSQFKSSDFHYLLFSTI